VNEGMAVSPFDGVLIANRGEIACRIIRTCARMGVRSVAVYSDADRDAQHVVLADEAYRVGGAAARDSYLQPQRILEIARRAGVQAIHPGYGFLSENDAFADACEDAGIVFIGPPADAIRAMGSKSAAKALMQKAGVPLVPGYHGDEQSPAKLAEAAAEVGYPVMIKASAGGGGKGMRIVPDPVSFLEALESCKRESMAAFGDDRMLVERYVTKPRHVEIQIFADRHAGAVHLFERDCSVQRRHQKVIEEAPAPGLSDAQRAEMGRVAVEAARAVNYVGAGTVEFIVDSDGAFHFMEMNTRLQVEHPVTEMITGLDLVEWQLRVAAGEKLPLTQEAISFRGHAFEARIYAEDPSTGFLPSTGRLHHLSFPSPSNHVRIETGVASGDVITPHYDPMIAKLVVWDESRGAALRRLRSALDRTRIAGVTSNVSFLSRITRLDAFATGQFDTGLIEDEGETLLGHGPPSAVAWASAAASVVMRERDAASTFPNDPWSPWGLAGPWRLNGRKRRELVLASGDFVSTLVVEEHAGRVRIEHDGSSFEVLDGQSEGGRLSLVENDRRVESSAFVVDERIDVFADGQRAVFRVLDPLAHAGEHEESADSLHSPMPGTVIEILVEAGATVERGERLLVLEAMKMEHAITAPSAGVVRALLCGVGDQVPERAELIDFEPAEEGS
jgi:3-methylcrotonyl-CoA carboxylase alpha subunit